MDEIPVTTKHCWVSIYKPKLRFWSRVWGLDKAKLKVDYLGAIPVESAVVGDVLVDERGVLYTCVLKGMVRNVYAFMEEFHIPKFLKITGSTYAEKT